ncbi:32879_t:CDS:2 [Racocetra persica]|uniref:32879_t:CDS:1 n=1 Tax=Racocetra persica TaxID=160502 RepID=A0ACA9S1W2_9GLOM|nr:32879_t:CDS:2 [Racocetra persica]
MPRPTSCQKKAIKAYEAKVYKHSADNSEAENSDDISNLSVCDEAIENNNATSIMKRFQAAAQQYDHNSDNTDDHNDNFSAYNEPIENDNAENIIKKLQNAVNKYYQEYNYNQTRRLRYLGNLVCTKRKKRQQQRESENENQLKKVNEKQSENKDQLEEVNEDEEDFGELSENKIEACNLLKKISATLENLALDIKKENVNSEVWVCLNSIRFYLQLVKNNHQKIKASKIIADAAGKGVYHAKCIRSWAHKYVIARSLGFAPPPTISLNTAKNYLKELEYIYERVKKGVYIDGHKREDVVAYRKIFL